MKKVKTINMFQTESTPLIENSIKIEDFNVWIKDKHILKGINLAIAKNQISCIVGPSGSGKSTLIRSINRINDTVGAINLKGQIKFNGTSIYSKSIDVSDLRSQIGMVFQKPCIFPKSIQENVLFGIQQHKKLTKNEQFEIVEGNLKKVALWNEVSDRLKDKASNLSIGQQQRLCIARTLAVNPSIILLDEPTSALDPLSTKAIEEMMLELKKDYTIIFVTHNIQQASRIADKLIFISDGEIIEQGKSEALFSNPQETKTKEYLQVQNG